MLEIVFEIVLNKFKGIDQIEGQHFDFKISKIYCSLQIEFVTN